MPVQKCQSAQIAQTGPRRRRRETLIVKPVLRPFLG
jgi:hypothetical protein